MTSPVEKAVVRICRADNSIVGAGFLVKEKIVLTCAHVIDDAMGSNKHISLDFPRISPNSFLKADIKFKNSESDIAILELFEDLLSGAMGVNPASQEDLWGHPFETFGFPNDYDDGVWANGICRRANAKGWLQIEDINDIGYNIEIGFSGSPVWDKDLDALVGMVVAVDNGKRSAFAIPIKMLIAAWSELKTVWSLDDPWMMINEEMKLMTTDSKYEHFIPLIDSLKQIARNRYFEHTDIIIKAIINIIKKLDEEKQNPAFSEIFERLALGFIPNDWIVSEIGDDTKNDLIKCVIRIFADNRNKLIKAFGINICVPVVLVVMTNKEASELESRTIFDPQFDILLNDFERFEELLKEEGLEEWVDSYGESPSNWRPFNGEGKTIEELIRRKLYDLRFGEINPIFIDVQTLNRECYRPTLKKLREQGCVVITDVISMQHPVIQQEFRRSLLDAFPCNLVAKIAPNMSILEFIRDLSIVFELHADIEFYKRCRIDEDRRCRRIHNEYDFGDWFGEQVKKLPMLKNAKKI